MLHGDRYWSPSLVPRRCQVSLYARPMGTDGDRDMNVMIILELFE